MFALDHLERAVLNFLAVVDKVEPRSPRRIHDGGNSRAAKTWRWGRRMTEGSYPTACVARGWLLILLLLVSEPVTDGGV